MENKREESKANPSGIESNTFRSLAGSPNCKVFVNPKSRCQSLQEAIERASNITIVGHNNPDGDAVGATQALYQYLLNSGKNAKVIYPNHFAQNLAWMDLHQSSINYQDHPDEIKTVMQGCDLLFVLDFNRVSRTESMAPVLKEKDCVRIMIDHHLDPEWQDFDIAYSDTTVSSTCELLYRVIHAELNPDLIDSHVSNCLYAGISTDTGSFSYSCGHKGIFETIADLISRGLDTVKVHQNIFDNFSESRMRLLGCCLGDRLVVKPEYNTAYMYLSDEDMRKYNYQAGDTEGIVNYGLSMSGIYFAAFFTQRNNRIRMSYRSQGDIDVNIFAKENFGGGGHKNAAGGTSYESLEATSAKFEAALPAFYENSIKPAVEKLKKTGYNPSGYISSEAEENSEQ